METVREKRGAFGVFLREGAVFVHIDARKPGVEVPEHLRKPHLVLNYSLDLFTKVPVIDLRADDQSLSATLMLDDKQCKTVIPWDTIYAITNPDGFGLMWEGSLPSDVKFTVRKLEGEVKLHLVN